VTVRYNTLMVITHLVLNDMIKVKGQVSHVALSLNDPCEAIAELAKLFFIKLSERSNNPVYNLLGDIIGIFSQEQGAPSGNNSNSSAGEVEVPALSKEQFQTTMHFLLSFVQKDKYVRVSNIAGCCHLCFTCRCCLSFFIAGAHTAH
jgi:condensin complex subunit 1